MEILQTIWTALTNENELLLNIVCIPLTFIEISVTMLIFTTVLNINSNNKQKITYVVLFSAISLLNLILSQVYVYTFFNIFIMPILVYFIFKTNILKALTSEVITYISVLSVSAPLVLIYCKILEIPTIITSTIPIHKIIVSLLLYSFLYVIYRILKKFDIKFSILDKFEDKQSHLLIVNFLIGSLSIGIEAYLLFRYIDFIPTAFLFTILFVLLLYFSISMFSLIRTNKLEITTRLLEEQKMYNKTLNTLHDNIRGFKHDFDNIVQAVGGYLSINNIDGLQSYYKDLLEECQINNNLSILNPELINNPAIYSLLSDKYYKSEELGIKMNLEVMTDLSNLNIKMYELTRILGVLFDNAIEAASKCETKTVNIIFRKDKKRNKDLVIIQNTYTNKDVNINKIFEKGYTSKQENEKDKNHGLGLWEVRKYLRKNPHLDLYTTKTDDLFTQQFEIYN